MALENKNERVPEKHLYTAHREMGYRVDRVETVEQGMAKIAEYEQTDREQDNYAPDFYDVVETERTSIWVVIRDEGTMLSQLGHAWSKERAYYLAERAWDRMSWWEKRDHHQDLHIYQYTYDFETDMSAELSFDRAEYCTDEWGEMDIDDVIDYGDARWAEEKAEEEKALKESERMLAD